MKRIFILGILLLQGCVMERSGSGRAIYNEKCAMCHGAQGKGDGPLAADLGKAPADLTQIAARRGGVWPRLEVMSIVDGYSKRYLPGSEMPIYDDFVEGPLVTFDTGNGTTSRTPQPLLLIVDYLETLQDPAPTRTVP